MQGGSSQLPPPTSSDKIFRRRSEVVGQNTFGLWSWQPCSSHTTLGSSSNLFMHLSPHLSLLLLSPAVKGFGWEAVPHGVRLPGVAGS